MVIPASIVNKTPYSSSHVKETTTASPTVISTSSIANRTFAFLSNSLPGRFCTRTIKILYDSALFFIRAIQKIISAFSSLFKDSNPFISHAQLVDIALALGYLKKENDISGACNGIARMGMNAVFVGDVDIFNTRLQKLKTLLNIHKGDIGNLVNAIKADPTLLNEFLPLFEGIALWQQPDICIKTCPDLFRKETKPRFQEDPRSIDDLLMMTESKKLKDIGGIRRVADFSGGYDFNELISYLKHFRKVFEKSETSAAIKISTGHHAFSIVYDLAKKSWFCIDANELPIQEIKEDSNVAKFIKSGCLTKDTSHVFSSHIYTFKNKKGIALQKNLKQSFEEEEFKKLHEISDKKLKLLGLKKHTLLVLSVKTNSTETIKSLLDKGVDPNITFTEKDTPLFSACMRGNLPLVKLLIANGANPSMKDGKPDPRPFFAACSNGDIDIVKTLLANKADPNLLFNGASPLLAACRSGHVDVVKVLLSNGADPNITFTEKEDTPLASACAMSNLPLVKLLIANGANLNMKDGKPDPTLLFIACLNGDIDIVKTLLANKADPNLLFDGRSPLVVACRSGHVDLVKVLLSNGADPNITYNGLSPLTLAIMNGNQDIAQLLEKALKKAKKG